MLAVGTVAALIRLRVPTLVCCGMGLSRSPALAAVALAIVRREPPDEVLRMIGRSPPGGRLARLLARGPDVRPIPSASKIASDRRT